MTSITWDYVNTGVWGNLSIEYKPISGGTGTRQLYQMWDVTNNQPMYVTQSYPASSSHVYDIERGTTGSELDIWYDFGGDLPVYMRAHSSTTLPSNTWWHGSNTFWQVTSTDKYLHFFSGNGVHLGYMDAWTPFQGSSGGNSAPPPTGQPVAPTPQVTGITFTKTGPYELTVDFTYNNIRVSPNSPTTDVEYMVIKNITDGTTVWSEHVSSAVTQPATHSVVLDISPNGTYANAFGHGDQIQLLHTDYNGDATDYDDTIHYGDQKRIYSYLASGPFDVSYKKVPGYALYNLQVKDLNPFPDNGTRIKVRDLDGNDLSDNQGNVIGGAALHDLDLNSTPSYYNSFALNKSDVKPFVKLYLKHFYNFTNGTYTDYLFHSNLRLASNVSSNFW